MQNIKLKGHNKKAFSFIEVIITASIIVLLTVIGISSKNSYDEKKNNTKVLSDVLTINNAIDSYYQEEKTLAMPGGNNNFFANDTSYTHSYEDENTFGVYGNITENTIAKKYLDILPLDPRTNSYYSYGKTKNSQEFEIAAVQIIDGTPSTKITGNYSGENGPHSLIREYNGSNFVYEGSTTNLPYNPDELILIATDSLGNIYREGDTITTGAGEEKEIFFSDGSVSILEQNSSLTLNKLNFPNGDNLNTIIKLALGAGSIWTKATKLNDSSEFEVYTTDSTAAVRGTIFGVKKDTNQTETIVIEGEVEIFSTEIYSPLESLEKGNSLTSPGELKVEKGNSPKSKTVRSGQAENTIEISINSPLEDFSINEDIRGDDFLVENDIVNDLENNNVEVPEIDENGSCMYNGESVENGDIVSYFSTNSAISPDTCSNYMEETTCVDGNIQAPAGYPYSSCDNLTAQDCIAGDFTDTNGINYTYVNFNHGGHQYVYNTGVAITNGTIDYMNKLECNNGSVNEYNGGSYFTATTSCVNGYSQDGNQCSCDTFDIAGICQDSQADSSLTSNGFELYAYAPFNTNGDLNIYSNNSITTNYEYIVGTNCGEIDSDSDQCDSNNTTFGATSYHANNSFATYLDGTNGIYIDADNSGDYLRYSNLGLTGDFAIEMSVRGIDLKRNNGYYYLFQTDTNNKIQLYNYNSTHNLSGNNGNNIAINSYNSELADSTFYKVQYICSNGNQTIKIVDSSGETIKENSVGDCYNFDTLYVGSNKNEESQWNGIIDYVKIYK